MATIASLLADHLTLKVRSVDRIFLQGYVPRLMSEGLVCRFLRDRGYKIPSPVLLGKIGKGFVAAIERYATERYPVRADSRVERTEGERVEVDRRGEPLLRRYARERKLLRLRIGDLELDEGPELIAYLAGHFQIPDPGDVASRLPAQFADARALLEQIAADNRFSTGASSLTTWRDWWSRAPG